MTDSGAASSDERKAEEGWYCRKCTLLNAHSRRACEACDSAKPKKDDAPRAAKRYVVNLDAKPQERWVDVVKAYKKEFAGAQEYLQNMLVMLHAPVKAFNAKEAKAAAEAAATDSKSAGGDAKAAPAGSSGQKSASQHSDIIAQLEAEVKAGKVMYGEELEAVATHSGMPLGAVVLLQLAYEAAARCTSIVCQTADGTVLHGRTMDWGALFLKDMTIEVDFQRGGKTAFVATTWAGYVGVLTGVCPGAFSVSVNFRHLGDSIMQNLQALRDGHWPIGSLVRHVLETGLPFDKAAAALASTALAAPCYLILAGVDSKEGCLITRNRTGEEKRKSLSDGAVICTNIDHWSADRRHDIMDSIRRRALAADFFASAAQKQKVKDEAQLWTLLARQPILNVITLYTTVMCAKTGALNTLIAVGGGDE